MNAPRTDEMFNSWDVTGLFKLSAQLERELIESQEKVKELREALSILEQQIDYGQVDVALDYVRAILEKTK